MSNYKLTVFMKTGHIFANRDIVDQEFVDTIYDCIADNTDMVIQVRVGRTAAVMVPLKNVDFVKIEMKNY